jgi:fermentation-respiration switch protein FrsA (DUF1100 family)
MIGRQYASAIVLATVFVVVGAGSAAGQTGETLTIRGRPQLLRLYGSRGGTPAIVSSGDGGWIHLGPHVAEQLAARGFFVVGFDVRAYLSGFTTGGGTLGTGDEPGDYKALVDFAARGTTYKPILIGVSEGAGLSVLAATDPHTRAAIAGVIGLGLPDLNELGWRWRDALTYITHGTPNEPTFSTAAFVARIAPLPLAVIHSTHDEFVPLSEAQQIVDRAQPPKRLWTVTATNHRFSGNVEEFNRALFEAIDWINRGSNASSAAR